MKITLIGGSQQLLFLTWILSVCQALRSIYTAFVRDGQNISTYLSESLKKENQNTEKISPNIMYILGSRFSVNMQMDLIKTLRRSLFRLGDLCLIYLVFFISCSHVFPDTFQAERLQSRTFINICRIFKFFSICRQRGVFYMAAKFASFVQLQKSEFQSYYKKTGYICYR